MGGGFKAVTGCLIESFIAYRPLKVDKDDRENEGNASRSSAASSSRWAHLIPGPHLPRLWCSTAAWLSCLPLISPTQMHPGRLSPLCWEVPAPHPHPFATSFHQLRRSPTQTPSCNLGSSLSPPPACVGVGPEPDLPQLDHDYKSLTPVSGQQMFWRNPDTGSLGFSPMRGGVRRKG